MHHTNTVYSNIANIRTTSLELVFEFGAVFPEASPVVVRAEFEPEVRVVLPLQALKGLVEGLQKALSAIESGQVPQPVPAKVTAKQ